MCPTYSRKIYTQHVILVLSLVIAGCYLVVALPVCFGIQSDDHTVCSGNGMCIANDTCSCFGGIDERCCNFGFSGLNCETNLTTGCLPIEDCTFTANFIVEEPIYDLAADYALFFNFDSLTSYGSYGDVLEKSKPVSLYPTNVEVEAIVRKKGGALRFANSNFLQQYRIVYPTAASVSFSEKYRHVFISKSSIDGLRMFIDKVECSMDGSSLANTKLEFSKGIRPDILTDSQRSSIGYDLHTSMNPLSGYIDELYVFYSAEPIYADIKAKASLLYYMGNGCHGKTFDEFPNICRGGECIGENECSCTGYYRKDIDGYCNDFDCFGLSKGDSNVCSGRGTCSDIDTCVCDNSYTNYTINCSLLSSPAPANNVMNQQYLLSTIYRSKYSISNLLFESKSKTLYFFNDLDTIKGLQLNDSTLFDLGTASNMEHRYIFPTINLWKGNLVWISMYGYGLTAMDLYSKQETKLSDGFVNLLSVDHTTDNGYSIIVNSQQPAIQNLTGGNTTTVSGIGSNWLSFMYCKSTLFANVHDSNGNYIQKINNYGTFKFNVQGLVSWDCYNDEMYWTNNYQINKISIGSDNQIVTIIGNGTFGITSDGQFSNTSLAAPTYLSIDQSNGDIYFTENNNIRKLSQYSIDCSIPSNLKNLQCTSSNSNSTVNVVTFTSQHLLSLNSTVSITSSLKKSSNQKYLLSTVYRSQYVLSNLLFENKTKSLYFFNDRPYIKGLQLNGSKLFDAGVAMNMDYTYRLPTFNLWKGNLVWITTSGRLTKMDPLTKVQTPVDGFVYLFSADHTTDNAYYFETNPQTPMLNLTNGNLMTVFEVRNNWYSFMYCKNTLFANGLDDSTGVYYIQKINNYGNVKFTVEGFVSWDCYNDEMYWTITDNNYYQINKISIGSDNQIFTIIGNGTFGITNDGEVSQSVVVAPTYLSIDQSNGDIYFIELNNTIRKLSLSSSNMTINSQNGTSLITVSNNTNIVKKYQISTVYKDASTFPSKLVFESKTKTLCFFNGSINIMGLHADGALFDTGFGFIEPLSLHIWKGNLVTTMASYIFMQPLNSTQFIRNELQIYNIFSADHLTDNAYFLHRSIFLTIQNITSPDLRNFNSTKYYFGTGWTSFMFCKDTLFATTVNTVGSQSYYSLLKFNEFGNYTIKVDCKVSWDCYSDEMYWTTTCNNYQINKISIGRDNQITTVLGNGTFGITPDGEASQNSLISPTYLAIDQTNGDIYFTENYKIRKFSLQTISATIYNNSLNSNQSMTNSSIFNNDVTSLNSTHQSSSLNGTLSVANISLNSTSTTSVCSSVVDYNSWFSADELFEKTKKTFCDQESMEAQMKEDALFKMLFFNSESDMEAMFLFDNIMDPSSIASGLDEVQYIVIDCSAQANSNSPNVTSNSTSDVSLNTTSILGNQSITNSSVLNTTSPISNITQQITNTSDSFSNSSISNTSTLNTTLSDRNNSTIDNSMNLNTTRDNSSFVTNSTIENNASNFTNQTNSTTGDMFSNSTSFSNSSNNFNSSLNNNTSSNSTLDNLNMTTTLNTTTLNSTRDNSSLIDTFGNSTLDNSTLNSNSSLNNSSISEMSNSTIDNSTFSNQTNSTKDTNESPFNSTLPFSNQTLNITENTNLSLINTSTNSSLSNNTSMTTANETLGINQTTSSNSTTCTEGYYGANCSLPICFGILSEDPNVCNGTSNCTKPDHCENKTIALPQKPVTIATSNSSLVESVYAEITSNFDGITFKLFAPISYSSNSIACKNLIHVDDVLMFGTESKCFWTNKTSSNFKIQFDYDFKLDSNLSFRLNSNVFTMKKRALNSEYIRMYIIIPNTLQSPVAKIKTTKKIYNVNEDIYISGSNSYSGDKKELEYYWNIQGNSIPISTISSISSSKGSSIKIDKGILHQGVYNISLIVKSSATSQVSSIEFTSFEIQSVELPTVSIIGEKELFLKSTSKQVTIKKTSSVPSYLSGQTTIEWEQVSGPSVKFRKDPHNNLVIDKFPSGKSKYMFTVSILSPNNQSSSDSITINTIQPDLTLSLSLKESSSLSNSIQVNYVDPENNLDEKEVWQWNCINSETNGYCGSTSSDKLNHYSIDQAFEIIMKQEDFDSLEKPKLTLTITKGGRRVSDFITLNVVHSPPIVKVINVSPASQSIVKGSDKISIEVIHSDKDASDPTLLLKTQWKIDGSIVYESVVSETIPSTVQSSYSSYVKIVKNNEQSGITIDASGLEEGIDHSIQFIALFVKKQNGSNDLIEISQSESSFSFFKASKPKKCPCSVLPLVGVSMTTDFTLTCQNCQNEANSIQIKQGYIHSDSGIKVGITLTPEGSFKLPAMSQEIINLFIELLDSSTGESRIMFTNVTVTRALVSSISEIFQQVSNQTNTIKESFIQDGDTSQSISQTINTIVSTTQMLKTLPQDQQDSTIISQIQTQLIDTLTSAVDTISGETISESTSSMIVYALHSMVNSEDKLGQNIIEKSFSILDNVVNQAINSELQISDQTTQTFMSIIENLSNNTQYLSNFNEQLTKEKAITSLVEKLSQSIVQEQPVFSDPVILGNVKTDKVYSKDLVNSTIPSVVVGNSNLNSYYYINVTFPDISHSSTFNLYRPLIYTFSVQQNIPTLMQKLIYEQDANSSLVVVSPFSGCLYVSSDNSSSLTQNVTFHVRISSEDYGIGEISTYSCIQIMQNSLENSTLCSISGFNNASSVIDCTCAITDMFRNVIVIQNTTTDSTGQMLNRVVVPVGSINSLADVIIVCSVIGATCIILILIGMITLYLCLLRKKRKHYLQRDEEVDTESQHLKRQLVFHTSKLSESESSLVTVKLFF